MLKENKIMRYIYILILIIFTNNLSAEDIDYKVVKGLFITSEGIIPAACFGQLITELNGDDTVAAIFITKTRLRGCIDANSPYPGGDEKSISYTIKEKLPNHTFKITVRKLINGRGSMGCSDSNLIVKFTNRKYLLENKKSKNVLTLEKLGEW